MDPLEQRYLQQKQAEEQDRVEEDLVQKKYEEARRNEEQLRKHQLRASMIQAYSTTPDEHAKQLKTVGRQGVVAGHKSFFDAERELDASDFPLETMHEQTPVLAEKLKDPDFAAVARDDVKNLGVLEQMMTGNTQSGNYLSRTLKGMGAGIFKGTAQLVNVLPTYYQMGKEVGWEPLPFTLMRMAGRQDLVEKIDKRVEGFDLNIEGVGSKLKHEDLFQRFLFEGTTMTPQIVASLFAGGPLGAFAVNYSMETAGAWDEMDLEVDPVTGKKLPFLSRFLSSHAVGGINGAIELIPLQKYNRLMGRDFYKKLVTNGVKEAIQEFTKRGVFKRFLREHITAAALEGVTEAVQEGTLMGAIALDKELANSKGANFQQISLEEARDRAVDAAIAGFFGGAFNATVLGTPKLTRDLYRAHQADRDQLLLLGLNQAAMESTLRQRADEEFAGFIQEVSGTNRDGNAYLPGEQFKVLFQEGDPVEIAVAMGADESQARHAIQNNTDIVIPLRDFVTKIAPNQDLFDRVKQDVKLAADGMTVRQAMELREKLKPIFEDLEKQTKDGSLSSFETRMREAMINGLMVTNRVSREVAEESVKPVMLFIHRSILEYEEQDKKLGVTRSRDMIAEDLFPRQIKILDNLPVELTGSLESNDPRVARRREIENQIFNLKAMVKAKSEQEGSSINWRGEQQKLIKALKAEGKALDKELKDAGLDWKKGFKRLFSTEYLDYRIPWAETRFKSYRENRRVSEERFQALYASFLKEKGFIESPRSPEDLEFNERIVNQALHENKEIAGENLTVLYWGSRAAGLEEELRQLKFHRGRHKREDLFTQPLGDDFFKDFDEEFRKWKEQREGPKGFVLNPKSPDEVTDASLKVNDDLLNFDDDTIRHINEALYAYYDSLASDERIADPLDAFRDLNNLRDVFAGDEAIIRWIDQIEVGKFATVDATDDYAALLEGFREGFGQGASPNDLLIYINEDLGRRLEDPPADQFMSTIEVWTVTGLRAWWDPNHTWGAAAAEIRRVLSNETDDAVPDVRFVDDGFEILDTEFERLGPLSDKLVEYIKSVTEEFSRETYRTDARPTFVKIFDAIMTEGARNSDIWNDVKDLGPAGDLKEVAKELWTWWFYGENPLDEGPLYQPLDQAGEDLLALRSKLIAELTQLAQGYEAVRGPATVQVMQIAMANGFQDVDQFKRILSQALSAGRERLRDVDHQVSLLYYDKLKSSPQFAAFTAGSHAVDSGGRPVLLYHFSGYGDFDEYRISSFSSRMIESTGMWLAESQTIGPPVLQMHGIRGHNQTTEMRGYARITNPFIVTVREALVDEVAVVAASGLAQRGVLKGPAFNNLRNNRPMLSQDLKQMMNLLGKTWTDVVDEHERLWNTMTNDVDRTRLLFMWSQNDLVAEYFVPDEFGVHTRRVMQSLGYDGIQINDDLGFGPVWVPFESNQFKRVENLGSWNMADPRFLFQDDTDTNRAKPFFSAARRAIETAKVTKAPADQWLQILKNAPGVKVEELEWTLLSEFLQQVADDSAKNGRKISLSKEAMLDFMNDHEVKISIVRSGDRDVQSLIDSEEELLNEAKAQYEKEVKLLDQMQILKDHTLVSPQDAAADPEFMVAKLKETAEQHGYTFKTDPVTGDYVMVNLSTGREYVDIAELTNDDLGRALMRGFQNIWRKRVPIGPDGHMVKFNNYVIDPLNNVAVPSGMHYAVLAAVHNRHEYELDHIHGWNISTLFRLQVQAVANERRIIKERTRNLEIIRKYNMSVQHYERLQRVEGRLTRTEAAIEEAKSWVLNATTIEHGQWQHRVLLEKAVKDRLIPFLHPHGWNADVHWDDPVGSYIINLIHQTDDGQVQVYNPYVIPEDAPQVVHEIAQVLDELFRTMRGADEDVIIYDGEYVAIPTVIDDHVVPSVQMIAGSAYRKAYHSVQGGTRLDVATVYPSALEYMNRQLNLQITNLKAEANSIRNSGQRQPAYSSYTINTIAPSLDYSNYREILITVPKVSPAFTESHWHGLRNVILHIRTSDRMEGNKKVLFIEELQSDWHQKGREFGYMGDPVDQHAKIIEDLRKEWDEAFAKFVELKAKYIHQYLAVAGTRTSIANIGTFELGFNEWLRTNVDEAKIVDKQMDFIREEIDFYEDGGTRVQEGPFKDSWYDLGVKYILRYAAENGYDSIAWTTGTQQTEIYGRQVSAVDTIHYKRDRENSYTIWGSKDGQTVTQVRNNLRRKPSRPGAQDDLGSLIGNANVQKIFDQIRQTWEFEGTIPFSGEIGGNGFREFYDKMVPGAFRRAGKKGVTLREVTFGTKIDEDRLSIPTKEFLADVGDEEEAVENSRALVTSNVMAVQATVQRFSHAEAEYHDASDSYDTGRADATFNEMMSAAMTGVQEYEQLIRAATIRGQLLALAGKTLDHESRQLLRQIPGHTTMTPRELIDELENNYVYEPEIFQEILHEGRRASEKAEQAAYAKIASAYYHMKLPRVHSPSPELSNLITFTGSPAAVLANSEASVGRIETAIDANLDWLNAQNERDAPDPDQDMFDHHLTRLGELLDELLKEYKRQAELYAMMEKQPPWFVPSTQEDVNTAEDIASRSADDNDWDRFVDSSKDEVIAKASIFYESYAKPAVGVKVHGLTINDDLKKKALNEGFPLFHEDPHGPRGYTAIDSNGDVLIGLLESANLSTFLHESAHVIMRLTRDLISRADCPESIKVNAKAIARYLGADNLDSLTREQHEKFARSFEQYLRTGKPPAPWMANSFGRYRSWLLSVYERAEALGVPMSEDVQNIFDNLLQAESEVEDSERAMGFLPIADRPEDLGLTMEEWNIYKAWQERARNEAIDELARAVAEGKAGASRDWYREQYKKVLEAVTARINSMPSYQVLHFLSYGVMLDGSDVPEELKDSSGKPVKLSGKKLKEIYGDRFPGALPRLGKGTLYTRTTKEPAGASPYFFNEEDGVTPDYLAQFFGYDSGEQLILDILNLEPRERRIVRETKEAMSEFFKEAVSDGMVEKASQAVGTEARAATLISELEFIAKKLGNTVNARNMVPTMKAMAQRVIAGMRVRDIDYKVYVNNAVRAAREAGAAIQKGDFAKAFAAKQRQMVNFYLYQEAMRAQKSMDRMVKYLKDATSPKFLSRLGQANRTFDEQVKALLERFEFTRITKKEEAKRERLRAFIAKIEEEDGEVPEIPEDILDEAFKKNYRDMTLEELTGLFDTVKLIEHKARRHRKLIYRNREVDFQKAKAQLIAEAEANMKDRGPAPTTDSVMGVVDKFLEYGEGLDAALLKVEQVIDWLSGGDIDSAWRRYIWNPIEDAENYFHKRLEQVMGKVVEAYESVPDDQRARWEDHIKIPGIGEITRGDLISIALNVGNVGNFDKLLRGRGWKASNVEAALDLLTKEEWALVEKLWKAIDTLWEDSSALEKRVNGAAPPKVEGRVVQTKYGPIQGGYFPVVYDPKRSQRKQTYEKGPMAGLVNPEAYRAVTAQGHLQKRTNYADAILLDLGVVPNHIQQVIHDLAYREAFIAIQKILYDKDVDLVLRRRLGEKRSRVFRPWLHAIAGDHPNARGLGDWMRIFRWARSSMTVVAMGFKISTMLNQLLGWSTAMEGLDKGRLTKNIGKFLANPVKMTRLAWSLSPELKRRLKAADRDQKDKLQQLEGKRTVRARVAAAALWGVGYIDMLVSVPAFMSAYEQALKNGETNENAVRFANSRVRLTQGSGAAKDLATIQHTNELTKLITAFYTYFNAFYNRQRNAYRDLHNKGFRGVPQFVGRQLFLVAIPAIMGELLSGREPDEDESKWKWLLRKLFFYNFMGVPIARDLAAKLDSGYDFKLSPTQTYFEKLSNNLEAIGKMVEGEKDPVKVSLQTAETVGMLYGMPTSQVKITGTYWYDLYTGEEEYESFPEFMRKTSLTRREDKK